MKKMTILAVILALAIALTACGGKNASEESTPATADATVTSVPAETTAPAQPLALTSWNLSASTWSSPNGATVHISATPNRYEEGQQATFVVRLESDDVSTTPCQWDGTSYTASADLNAANGYCYYVVLTAADGTATEAAVNTPAAPTNEALINLEASLESYCSIIVEESTFTENKLTLNSCKVQVQTPAITNEGETIGCQEAVLVLNCNGETQELPVSGLAEAEAVGLYEADLSGTAFDIPEMEAEQNIELTLQVTLTNGQNLTAFGSSWVYNEENLLPVVG